jgi:hypothetical protein
VGGDENASWFWLFGGTGEGVRGARNGQQAKNQENDCGWWKNMPGAMGAGLGASAELVGGGAFGAINASWFRYQFLNGEVASATTVGASHLGRASADHAWGWAANIGLGPVFAITNASAPGQLSGPSRATTVTWGIVQLQLSRSGNGIWGFSVGIGKGIGTGISTYNYNSTVYQDPGSECSR